MNQTSQTQMISQIAIRCHPLAPVDPEELQVWLAAEIEHLRGDAPDAAIRLLRLSQSGPEGEIAVGWQIELGMAPSDSALDDEGLEGLISDLRLLGLQPSVLHVGASESDHPGFVEVGAIGV